MTMLARTTFSVALLLAALPALAQTAPPPSVPPPKWGAWLDLEGKIGNKRNLGEADVFLPLWQDGTSLVFGNVKTRLDDYGSKEGNLGAGLRHMLESGWNLGTYGFFDRRRTEHAQYFNQVTLGAEALSLDWDFRANVYLPQGRRSKNVDSLSTAEISGSSVVFRGGEERSLTGFDGEIGYRVPIYAPDADRQLRVYGGGYRFYGEGVNPVQGPRARAEFVFDEVTELWQGARLSIGGEAQHDAPRGSQFFFGARLRIPLQVFAGGSGNSPLRLTPMERRMADPVVRDVDVVAQGGAFGAPEAVTQTAGGSAISVLSSATTSGANLGAALTAAGANSTVILSGTFNTTAQYSMQSGQTLMGNGSVAVRSLSGRVAVLNTNTSGTISGTNIGASTLLMNDNDTAVIGLTVTNAYSGGGGGAAFQIGGAANNVRILNNTFIVTQSGANGGVAVSSAGGAANSNVLIQGNTITATGSGAATTMTALLLNTSNASTYTVQGNTITASGGTTNNIVNLGSIGSTINAGSDSNVRGGGNCAGTVGSGSILFTNGTACP